MSNPNNCAACDHKRFPDGGHCYMFRDAPTDACHKHTARYMKLLTPCQKIREDNQPCGLLPPCPDCGSCLIG